MAIDLVTKYLPYVDEILTEESKKAVVTNQDFDWIGAHTVKIRKVSTADMNDYDRTGSGENSSRYGVVTDLTSSVETFTLSKDRSFTFVIDKLDNDETQEALEGATALARQIREKVIPEIDSYTYGVMATNAGTKPTAKELTATSIYEDIIDGGEVLDEKKVPSENRSIIVTPAVYKLMKKSTKILLDTDLSDEKRAKGVIAEIDGNNVIVLASDVLPTNFGFMICHPIATVAPVKLEEYKIHSDPQGYSGQLVEGRVCYDAFVLDNKKYAIYYQAIKAGT